MCFRNISQIATYTVYKSISTSAILCPDTPIARQLLFPGVAGRIVKKGRAPKFYFMGLPEIMCWEPHGLQLYKVSVDPCVLAQRWAVWTLEYTPGT